mmetsp:Transcript_122559/g.291339  ORF Transcript_122559/g.291339 Transcript_122559/m.291339 type:complete len:206 (+) Transcript_122559:3501-4118(+)
MNHKPAIRGMVRGTSQPDMCELQAWQPSHRLRPLSANVQQHLWQSNQRHRKDQQCQPSKKIPQKLQELPQYGRPPVTIVLCLKHFLGDEVRSPEGDEEKRVQRKKWQIQQQIADLLPEPQPRLLSAHGAGGCTDPVDGEDQAEAADGENHIMQDNTRVSQHSSMVGHRRGSRVASPHLLYLRREVRESVPRQQNQQAAGQGQEVQ